MDLVPAQIGHVQIEAAAESDFSQLDYFKSFAKNIYYLYLS